MGLGLKPGVGEVGPRGRESGTGAGPKSASLATPTTLWSTPTTLWSTEVRELGDPVVVQEDVAGLDVAVHEPPRVQVLQAPGRVADVGLGDAQPQGLGSRGRDEA